MNVNFGLMPPITGRHKRADRKKAYTERATAAFADWLQQLPPQLRDREESQSSLLSLG
jgi:methylenetetrahydrofolate--tRNA-(uracil-5-)-methyltransferase